MPSMDTSQETDRENVMERFLSNSAERKNTLQHLLREEMETHLKEGRTSVERNQERVKRMKQLKEELHREEKTQTNSPEESQQDGVPEEYCKLQEQMRKMKEKHAKVIREELLKMETELHEEQKEGLEGEVMYLRRERQILVLQIEALRQENQQAEADLKTQYKLHLQEMHCLREESLQVFRTFRQVLEEQKRLSEGRYRSLLLEAVQDAIHLSSQNQQLQAENMQLRKALAELKTVCDETKNK